MRFVILAFWIQTSKITYSNVQKDRKYNPTKIVFVYFSILLGVLCTVQEYIYIYIDIVASRISMNSWHDQSTFLPLLWPIPLGPPCECVAACTVVLVGSESSWSCQTCLRSCQLYKTVSKYCRAPPESNLIECLKQGLTSHKLCWWVKLSNGMAPWWKSARLLIGPRWVWSFSSCWISTKAVFLLQAASSHEQPLSCASLGSNIQKCGCAHTNTRIV